MLSALFADIALFPYEPPWLTVTVLIVFLFLLGGAIGSFLNVVIYRVPAGLSIVSPRSRCPRCLTPILARDNVPVVGWLMLRGRCRFCKAPIAARYPLVEAAAGVAFTLLCLGEAVFPGLTLPIPSTTADEYPLFGLAMYHFALLCGLGAAALMTYDGGVVPVAFWRVILLIGLLPPLVWPDLRPIPFHTAAPAYGRLAAGIADGAAGALFGALAGMAAWPVAVIGARARSGHLNSVAALSAVGAYLGWQAAAAVALAAAVLVLLREPLRRIEVAGRFPWLGFVFVAALALLLGWRYLAAHLVVGETLLLGPAAPAWFAAAAVVGTSALSLLSRRLHLPLAAQGVADARRAPSAPTH